MKALIFNENIEFTPFNIHTFFPNLEALDLLNKGTSELTRESLKGLNSLRLLNFGRNKLQTIETDLFIENPDMERLYFENNPLRHVAFNVFDDLQRLNFLDVTETLCIDQSATTIDQIDSLKFHILVQCPPTFEMLEEKVVNGSLLHKIVAALIDSNIDPIRDTLDKIEEEQRLLIERVDALEGDGKKLIKK